MPNEPESDEIVRLTDAANPQEAGLFQQALEAEGIRCKVVGEYLGSFGIAPQGYPEIWVHRADLERARAVLAACRPGR